MILRRMGKFTDFSRPRIPALVCFGVAAIFSMIPLFAGPAAPPEDTWTAIKAGRIQTVSKGEIDKGTILIRNGRIEEIGTDAAVPAAAKVLDFSDKFVMPGIVSPDSNLGIYKAPIRASESWYRQADPVGKNLAYYPVIYSVDPGHQDYERNQNPPGLLLPADRTRGCCLA